jgi:hypothetical protein
VWKNFTGVARSMDGKRVIKIGNPGAPDIMGLWRGRFIGIEVKSGAATQSNDQKLWQKMIETYGGVYIVARNLEDVTCQFRSCITWPEVKTQKT